MNWKIWFLISVSFWCSVHFAKSPKSPFLYFYPFKTKISSPTYSHLTETLPALLAFKSNTIGLTSTCRFFPKKPPLKSFDIFLIRGGILKDSADLLEVRLVLEKKKSREKLKRIHFRGTLQKVWEETNNFIMEIAKELKFYVDPVEVQNLRSWSLPIAPFRSFLEGYKEEQLLNFEGASNYYRQVLNMVPANSSSRNFIEKKLLKCLFRVDEFRYLKWENRLFEKNSYEPDVLYLKARNSYQKNETFEAHHWIRRALYKNKHHRKARVTQACMQVFEKKYKEAFKNMEELSIYHENETLIILTQILLKSPSKSPYEEIQPRLERAFKWFFDEDPWVLYVAALAAKKHKLIEAKNDFLKRALQQTRSVNYRKLLNKELKSFFD